MLDWSGKVIPSSSDDVGLYKETTSLKDKTTDLKVYIAVGGFGKKEARRFSRMASQRSSRKDFIHSAKKFMDEHNFDGIDIDWEYPAAYDRGGRQSDTENLVELVKEMKKEFGDKKGISVTVPAKGRKFYFPLFQPGDTNGIRLFARLQPGEDAGAYRHDQLHELRPTWILGKTIASPTRNQSNRYVSIHQSPSFP